MLSSQIAAKHLNDKCAVVALDDGGVMIGAQIASELKCVMMLLQTAEINLPLEPDPIAGITSGGSMAYNQRYSQGELDEMVGEYYGLIEQEKLTSMHDLNHLLGKGGVMNKDLLMGHHVILVSDGLKSALPLDLSVEFLKPLTIESIIVATPLASVTAVDRMHIVADEIYCLSVLEDYIGTDHYYDKHDVPDHDSVIRIIEQIVSKWQ